MRKFLVICLVLTAVLGCGKKPPDGKRTVVEVQMFSGPEYEAMVPTAEYWNEHYAQTTGITVHVTALNRVGYFDKIETQLMSGVSSPDIVHPFSLHLGRLQKYLEPLNTYLKNSEVMTCPVGHQHSLDNLLPFALQTVRTSDGAIYMIPSDMSEVILFYRKDLIDRPPETWDDFVATAKRFTRRINSGSPVTYGAIVQGKYEMWTFCAALENIWAYGGGLSFEKDAQQGVNQKGVVQGLKIYENLARSGVLPLSALNAEHPQVVEALRKGDVAMAMLWNAAYPQLTDPEKSPLVFDKIAIAPPPGVRQPDNEIQRFMYVQTIGLAINKESKNKVAAAKFLFWATLGEGTHVYSQAGGSSPVRSVWETKNPSSPYYQIGPWVDAFGRSAPVCKDVPGVLMIGSSWVQKIIAGVVSAEEAAEGMRAEIKAFLLRSDKSEL